MWLGRRRIGRLGTVLAPPDCRQIFEKKRLLEPHQGLPPTPPNMHPLLYPFFPLPDCQIFVEETSLVARPAVSFPDLKKRLDARLKFLGIKVWAKGGHLV